jgi:DHA2 family multidrug resistance protein
MTQRLKLIVFAILAVIPLGMTSAIYGSSAAEIAASLNLSLDEASWLNMVFLYAQLGMLPFASWSIYRYGYNQLARFGATFGAISALFIGFTDFVPAHLLSWFGHGLASSALLVAVQVQLLKQLSVKDFIHVEALIVVLVSFLPFGVYPWLFATMAEHGIWQLSFAVQVIFYIVVLAWLYLDSPFEENNVESTSFNYIHALIKLGAITGITFLLMRGQFHNWLDSPFIVEWLLFTGLLSVLTVTAIRYRWGQGDFLHSDVLSSDNTKVLMYNSALAGFASLGTATLIGSYLVSVLKYSQAEAGWLQLPSFVAIIGGMLFSLWVIKNPKIKSELTLPVGVLLILISCFFFSSGNSYSGEADMFIPLLVRGVGVGILNITITIGILLSFEDKYRPQGVSYFYIFRIIGGLAGTALFTRMNSYQLSETKAALVDNVTETSNAFIHYQNALTNVIESNMLEATPERIASLLSSQLQLQVGASGGTNNFQWFIMLIVCVLAPILIIGKKWAGRKVT